MDHFLLFLDIYYLNDIMLLKNYTEIEKIESQNETIKDLINLCSVNKFLNNNLEAILLKRTKKEKRNILTTNSSFNKKLLLNDLYFQEFELRSIIQWTIDNNSKVHFERIYEYYKNCYSAIDKFHFLKILRYEIKLGTIKKEISSFILDISSCNTYHHNYFKNFFSWWLID